MLKDFNSNSLRVRVYETRTKMGEAAAVEFAELLRKELSEKQVVNVIFAAAPSQMDFLVALRSQPNIDWKRVNAFHMDEYVGLSINCKQSFAGFVKEHVVDPLGIVNFYPIKGDAKNIKKERLRYTKLLDKFKPDIVCCGIGENAHLAFNDPGEADFFDSEIIKVVELDQVCRNQQVNDKCFDNIDKVPKYALTLTVPVLLRAKSIFCLVPCETKADAVKKTILGEINDMCPATALRLHKNANFYCDAQSGKYLLTD